MNTALYQALQSADANQEMATLAAEQTHAHAATRDDLKTLRDEFKTTRDEILATTRNELKTTRDELKSDIHRLERTMVTKNELRAGLAELKSWLLWRMVVVLIGQTAALGTIIAVVQ